MQKLSKLHPSVQDLLDQEVNSTQSQIATHNNATGGGGIANNLFGSSRPSGKGAGSDLFSQVADPTSMLLFRRIERLKQQGNDPNSTILNSPNNP